MIIDFLRKHLGKHWFALSILAATLCAIGNDSVKPPQVGVVSLTVDTANKYIVVTPACSKEDAKSKFEGRTALVQLKKVGPLVEEHDWDTIKRVEHFAFEPIRVDGVFVSGGKETLRRVRIVFLSEVE